MVALKILPFSRKGRTFSLESSGVVIPFRKCQPLKRIKIIIETDIYFSRFSEHAVYPDINKIYMTRRFP